MKHELIKTENYLLIVNDKEIKVGDWYLVNQYGRGLLLCTQPATEEDIKHQHKHDCKLIIAHLPLNEAKYLDGVDLLPKIKAEVDNLVEEEYFKFDQETRVVHRRQLQESLASMFNKAKETYKYTEDDLRKAISFGQVMDLWKEGEQVDKFIQSINHPKLPIAFEREIVRKGNGFYAYSWNTITNSEGRTEWVGKYLF
jgi:hypothetical protein